MPCAEEGNLAIDGLTIPRLLYRNATEFGSRPALTVLGSPDPTTLTCARRSWPGPVASPSSDCVPATAC